MDRDRWDRIQDLFLEALELPPFERRAFVSRAAGGDADLLDRVQKLLDADATPAFVDAEVGEVARDVLDGGSAAAPGVGETIGPYRLTRALGEGGTGVVYVATREDLGHDVAIKILRDAWVSERRRGQFLREQRLLARLNHPAIAHILDAGVLAGGTPWFAMELVDGVALDEYCRSRAVDRARIVRMVREVGAAVQHAHERLIVHRDLKPTNIVVTADGQPKLLDFGVARQIEAAASRGATGGLRMLTPAYASPEELRGETPGVQSDVYSLGVILRELLAAAGPSAFHRVSWLGRRAHRFDRTADRDLDAVCRIATAEDQSLRYPTVDALVRDLDAWLDGRPLSAAPASAGYRLRRFVSRNRRAVAAAALVAASFAGVAVVATARVASARAATEEAAVRAERRLQFLLDLFDGGGRGEAPSAELRVLSLVDRGVREADLLASDPEAQADLFNTLGRVSLELGDLDRADRLLAGALAVRRTTADADPAGLVSGLVAMADLRRVQARLDDAERLAHDALAEADRRLRQDDPDRLAALTAVGRVQGDRGDYKSAIATLERAIALYPPGGPTERDAAVAVKALADDYFYVGDMARAEEESRRALEMNRRARGSQHPEVGQALINLGAIASSRQEHAEAERYLREALAIIDAWFGREHPQTASAQTSLAQVLAQMARYDDAQALLDQAVTTQQRVFGPLHPKTAFVHNEAGMLAFMADDLERAAREFALAADGYGTAAGSHFQQGVSLANLGSVHLQHEDYGRARASFEEALRIYAEVLPDAHPNVAITRMKLGRTLLRQQRFDEARSHLEAAERVLAAQPGPESTWLKAAREDLAVVRARSASASGSR
ncbi:MAG: tetratricopeptide repeat protein [Vicinamibacterales bacterium]